LTRPNCPICNAPLTTNENLGNQALADLLARQADLEQQRLNEDYIAALLLEEEGINPNEAYGNLP